MSREAVFRNEGIVHKPHIAHERIRATTATLRRTCLVGFAVERPSVSGADLGRCGDRYVAFLYRPLVLLTGARGAKPPLPYGTSPLDNHHTLRPHQSTATAATSPARSRRGLGPSRSPWKMDRLSDTPPDSLVQHSTLTPRGVDFTRVTPSQSSPLSISAVLATCDNRLASPYRCAVGPQCSRNKSQTRPLHRSPGSPDLSVPATPSAARTSTVAAVPYNTPLPPSRRPGVRVGRLRPHLGRATVPLPEPRATDASRATAAWTDVKGLDWRRSSMR